VKWALYNILFAIVYPFLLPGFLLRMLRRGGYAARMGDRFALYPDRIVSAFKESEGEFVLIHAVSVGEVQVAAQFMREWRKVEKDVRFCFSTTSSTGWRVAGRELGDGDVLIYNPLDFPSFVKSALKLVKPRAVVLVESEIWPVFIRTAKKYDVPVFLVNARVSDRSAPRYRRARWFFKDVFSCFAAIFAQSKLDARRLIDAGAPEERVHVTGSFKFDAAHRAAPEKEDELRKWAGEGRILLGGSTWPGEDELLIGAYSKLRRRDSSLKLVIAPRHFEKADAVEANIVKAGFKCVRRSRGESAGGRDDEILLADTTGELMGFYGIADAVFVGKSLCEHGSQNMIEPCLCAKPVLVGPYTENFRPVMEELLSDNAVIQAVGVSDFEAKIEEILFGDKELGTRAAAAVESRRGVVARCVAQIRESIS
jgi:3-deoxy-D-manno-octulosonic-acid transferase